MTDIVNYYTYIKDTTATIKYKLYDKIHIDIPSNIIIVGGTGSGKTNLLINIFSKINVWDKVYLIVKDLEEPLYKMLINLIQKIEQKYGISMLFMTNNISEIPPIDSLDRTQYHLFIYDDMIMEKKKQLDQNIGQYFIRGRKVNVTNIFLSQRFALIPIVVRQNSQYIILKKINSKRELTFIVSDYSLDLTVDQITDLYKKTTAMDNFFLVDMKTNNPELKYRIGFDPFKNNTEKIDEKQINAKQKKSKTKPIIQLK